MKATFPEVSKLALTRPPAGRVGASLGSAGPALGPQGGQRQSRSEARPAARPGPAEVVSPTVSPPRPAVPDCPPARRAGLPAGCPGARFENCCRQSPRAAPAEDPGGSGTCPAPSGAPANQSQGGRGRRRGRAVTARCPRESRGHMDQTRKRVSSTWIKKGLF